MNAVVAEPQRRVLLVEDEAALARTVRDMLHAEGYQVETHGDGALALDAASTGAHNLISPGRDAPIDGRIRDIQYSS